MKKSFSDFKSVALNSAEMKLISGGAAPSGGGGSVGPVYTIKYNCTYTQGNQKFTESGDCGQTSEDGCLFSGNSKYSGWSGSCQAAP